MRAETERRVEEAYAKLLACTDDELRIAITADVILCAFDDFYCQLCEYPYRAQRAFETLDPQASNRISTERLGLYSRCIAEHGPRLLESFPALAERVEAWDTLDRLFVAMIVDRYEADIAFSFAHSLRRNIYHEMWRPVAYSFPPPSRLRALSMAQAHRRFEVRGRIDVDLLCEALGMPGFSVPFSDLRDDAERILERLRDLMPIDAAAGAAPLALDVVDAGFYRDRAAFLVGRWVFAEDRLMPFVVAFVNGADGIRADALLHRVSDIHDLFSSTLANFHVTTRLYYQTCVFLYSLMPLRPLGHHYSTIGFNHVGKVAILDEIVEQIRTSGQRFGRSPGAAGTVALGFTFDACSYHLKVVRDAPTVSYKWGAFPGVAAVVNKYREVHEINRAGSMLDNVMYYNLRLDRELFEPELLAEICEQARGSVHLDETGVFLRFLIVQMKIVPLPVYLDTCGDEEMRAAIVSLGHCIRNNAATNIFNKDLDSRNYGVGRYGRVFLFDYDAVEKLIEVKIRTNTDLEPGEEGVPAWFFENGVIFLPEELEHGMQFKNEWARRCFREVNRDLMTLEYWTRVQQMLKADELPELRMYPESAKLRVGVRTEEPE